MVQKIFNNFYNYPTNLQRIIMNDKQLTTPNRWLSVSDLANEYGFKKDTQAKLRMNKKIPYSKVGRKILYCRFSIDNWIEDNRVDVIA